MKIIPSDRQSIETKYLPATNCKGSRIRVKCERKTKYYSFDDGARCPHDAAVTRFLAEICEEDSVHPGTPPGENPWNGTWYKGSVPSIRGYVYVWEMA